MLIPYDRHAIFALILSNNISRKVAAEQLGVSIRHLRRLIHQYKNGDSNSFANNKKGNAGRIGYSNEFKKNIVRLYKERYSNLGLAAACEKLNEIEGIRISRESLRRWLIADKESK